MKSLLASLALLTVACGAPAPTGGNTPPPGGTVPAILAVQAGDGQQAEPGAALTVKPVVAVRDAAGLGVAGVTVNFSVDSGGGSLQATSAVTAADGTAGPGDWHLGATEGRNVMSASAVSLAKVKFVATGVLGTVTIATQTVGSGGKTISITTGALAGTSLVIPAGAFTQTATWTLEQRSNADWPRRTGVNPVGAVLHITSGDTGQAAQAMLLTLPAVVPAGTRPFVLMRDRATNAIEVLQTVTVDPGTITVAVMHFDASWIPPSRAAGTGLRAFSRSGAQAATNYEAEVVVSAIPDADWNRDVDTGFRPGVDDWDFAPLPTSFTYGPQDTERAGIETGRVLTQMADFAYLKTPARGPLFKKYREIPGDPRTTKVGYQAASLWGYFACCLTRYITTIRNSTRAGQADQQFFDVLKANLIVTGLPQVVFATGTEWYPFTAYRITGGQVDMVSPFTPGVGTSLQFDAGRFAPFNSITEDGVSHPADWIGVAAVGQTVPMSKVAQDVADYEGGGTSDWIKSESFHWPKATVHSRGGFVEDTIMYAVDDTTRFWVECPDCRTGLTSSLPPGRVEPFLAYVPDKGFASFNGGGSDGVLLSPVHANDTRLGFMVLETGGNLESWLDFQWIRLKKWVMTLPADLTATISAPTTFTVAIEGTALMPAHRFAWTFGTGPTATTASSTSPTVTATLTQSGTLPVTIEMRRTSDDKVIAVGTGTVVVAPPIQVWKFTTKSIAFSTSGNFSPNFGYTDGRWQVDSTILARIAAGVSQGGIRLVDAPFTPPGSPLRTAPAGIYLLEGASITLATLDDPATDNNFITTTFANAPLALPAAPRVSGWNLVQDAAPVNPLCNVHADTYTRTGTITAGHVTGLRVPLCVQSVSLPVTNGQPLMSMEADVQFIGDGASGTITIAYHFYGEGLQSQNNAQRIGRLTFQATRVTQ